ncbi:MAG: histone deacetylase [Magnetovibrio sp.]|nr:histone deacetylase [Magnetovibrio sp.]
MRPFLLLTLLLIAACAGQGTAPVAPTGLVHDAAYLAHDNGPEHPERPDRLRAIMAGLETSGLMASLTRIAPRPAEARWITTVHTPDYLKTLETLSPEAPVHVDPDTVLGPGSLGIAKLAAGGVLAAVDAVAAGRVRNAFAAVRPPGHHALPNEAMGFCIFNAVAMAARYAQLKHGLKRVLIVDWDAHHGNGTQEMFYGDPSVLFFSTHESPHYPFTGAASETGAGAAKGTNLNVPLARGSGNREIIAAFRTRLVPAADAFKPDIVLISAGFDAHRADPLSGLGLTAEGYAALTRIVTDIAARHARGRVVSMLEGGYNLEALAASVAAHVAVLMGRDPKSLAPISLPEFTAQDWRREAHPVPAF